MTHYHVITDCQQMQVPPFMTDSREMAIRQYRCTVEMICNATGAEADLRSGQKTILSDDSTVRWNACNKDCLIRLTYDPAAEERKRREELAQMPREDERGYYE